jgi:hypothetical protein
LKNDKHTSCYFAATTTTTKKIKLTEKISFTIFGFRLFEKKEKREREISEERKLFSSEAVALIFILC